MNYECENLMWAKSIFGKSNLGDPRRVNRLIDVGARLAQDPSGSLSRICCGDDAAVEGAYRLIENRAVRPEDIAESIHLSGCAEIANREVCLAVQDTTTVKLSPRLTEGRTEQGNPSGYIVHSTLLVDGKNNEPFGIGTQSRWIRKPKEQRPGKKTRMQRPLAEKESNKWFAATKELETRLPSLSNVIAVCDREADIIEFLQYYTKQKYRFVVRAAHNRKTMSPTQKLVEAVECTAVMGHRTVEIGQRGQQRLVQGQQKRDARKAREASATIQATQVELLIPDNKSNKIKETVKLNVVLVNEPNPPTGKDGIRWILLTTEPIDTLTQIEQIVDYYSARWLIEDFHKAWKTGCNMENRFLQTEENFERMMVITAAVAVRILQLKKLAESNDKTCESIFSTEEWQCLHASTEKGKSLPTRAPSAKWAYYALAKLAGWTDSKRTGRVGWQTLWTGWERLQHRLEGWRIAIQMNQSVRNANNYD